MSFGENLQFLRKMSNKMTQEELAEKMGVSRQTISKWELNLVYPEMSKMIELCDLFSCSIDQLVREDMNICDEAFSEISMKEVKEFNYVCYAIISRDPENDAITHVTQLANELKITNPDIIGWDFPFISQEQINVFHMHGYTAALILDEETLQNHTEMEVINQKTQKYITLTIKQPFRAPFQLIPNAFKVLQTHMLVNGLKQKQDKNVINNFEKTYELDGVEYMDIFIAVEQLNPKMNV
ncbi:MAG TPA: helix-turn-helix domain-containing protein [Lachnospiraceae bacterium]|nr:helix-turn-helix domain-containing protein [Lachnospiraceae bacterium]